MTTLTGVTAWNVLAGLAARGSSIVTSTAIIGKTAVIHCGRGPGRRRVTNIASLCGCYMQRMFTCGDNAIVTRLTGTQSLCMVKGADGQRHPLGRGNAVTSLTGIGRVHMLTGFTRGDSAFVANQTLTNSLGMVYRCG